MTCKRAIASLILALLALHVTVSTASHVVLHVYNKSESNDESVLIDIKNAWTFARGHEVSLQINIATFSLLFLGRTEAMSFDLGCCRCWLRCWRLSMLCRPFTCRHGCQAM